MAEMGGGTNFIGTWRVADIAALVIILVEVSMGLFLMESLRITRLFPVIGALPDISMVTTGFDPGNRIKQTTAVEVLPSGSAGATGTMEGIFGGTNGTEIAGVIVLTGPDALSTVDVQETGAFVLLRNTYTP